MIKGVIMHDGLPIEEILVEDEDFIKRLEQLLKKFNVFYIPSDPKKCWITQDHLVSDTLFLPACYKIKNYQYVMN